MKHPKRYLTNGVATTRRVRGVVANSDCAIHEECYSVLTSWAGDTTPRPMPNMHAYVCKGSAAGSIGLLFAPENETPQWKAGVRKRVKNLSDSLARQSQD